MERHNGRASSSTEKFLRAVHPAFAVISVGADNDYGHPAQKTLSRLEAQDIQILRTDLSGTITAYSTPDTLTWRTGRRGSGLKKHTPKNNPRQQIPLQSN